MAQLIALSGMQKIQTKWGKIVKKKKKEAMQIRQDFIRTLVEELIANIPVWSGRTVRSVRVSTDGRQARREKTPDRADWAEYGATSQMALGEEPMRAASDAVALAAVANFGAYLTLQPIHVTISSEAWGLVEKAAAPTAPGRNQAVVSQIAISRARAAFPAVKTR